MSLFSRPPAPEPASADVALAALTARVDQADGLIGEVLRSHSSNRKLLSFYRAAGRARRRAET